MEKLKWSLWQWLGIVVAITVILGWSLDRWQLSSTIQLLQDEFKQFKDTTTALKPQFLDRYVRVCVGGNGAMAGLHPLIGADQNGIMKPLCIASTFDGLDGLPITIFWRFLRQLDGRDVYLFAVRPGLAASPSFDNPAETRTYVAYVGGRCLVLEKDQLRIEIVPTR